MAEVRGDNEEVGRVCQVLAEQFPIFVLLIFTQSSHEDGDDTKVVFTAAESHQFPLACCHVLNNALNAVKAHHYCHSTEK